MFNIDRHIAISAGWVAGPAFGVAMMAAPEYLHLGPLASGLLFWGGILLFLATITVVVIVSVHEDKETKSRARPNRNNDNRRADILRRRSLVLLAQRGQANTDPNAKYQR
jgi:hypothetical protein